MPPLPVPLAVSAPAASGRIVTSGFESGTIAGEGATGTGSAVIDSTVVRTGVKSLKSTDNGNSYIEYTPLGTADGETLYARLYFRVTGIPTVASMEIAEFTSAGDATQARVLLQVGGKLALFASASVGGGGVQIGITAAPIVVNTWYMLELAEMVSVAGNDYVEARLNSASFASSSGVNRYNSVPNRLLVGNYGASSGFNVYYDDVAINNSRGSSNNSWPGELPAITTTLGTTKLSRVPGKDAISVTIDSNEAFVEYEVRLVTDASATRISGTQVETAVVSSRTSHTISLTDDELVSANAVEGGNVLKAFVRDAAGVWSE